MGYLVELSSVSFSSVCLITVPFHRTKAFCFSDDLFTTCLNGNLACEDGAPRALRSVQGDNLHLSPWTMIASPWPSCYNLCREITHTDASRALTIVLKGVCVRVVHLQIYPIGYRSARERRLCLDVAWSTSFLSLLAHVLCLLFLTRRVDAGLL